ncbi:MAG: hypothetical protein ACFFE5_07225 [Candidatus Thorarchaeota archaeon]
MIKFPNKCIKCKKEDLKLEEFIYASSIMVRRFKTVYLKIPICDDCKKELMKYERIKKYLKLKYTFFCLFIISVFFLFVWRRDNSDIWPLIITFTSIVAVISGLLVLILLFAHLIFSRKNYDRITNYIEISIDGTIIIKDPEYRKAYEEFNEFAESKEDELFHCPRCNTLLMIGMEYCHVCGKKIV